MSHTPRDLATSLIALKRVFDAWLVSALGGDERDAPNTQSRAHTELADSRSFFKHCVRLGSRSPLLSGALVAFSRAPASEIRVDALRMLTLRLRPPAVPLGEWRDVALGKLVLAGARGDVASLAIVAILDMFGVVSSHTNVASYAPLYVELLKRATVTDDEADCIVFVAHAVSLPYNDANWSAIERRPCLQAPRFGGLDETMKALAEFAPPPGGIPRFPQDTPIFADHESFLEWPRDARDRMEARALELNTDERLPPLMQRVVSMRQARQRSRNPCAHDDAPIDRSASSRRISSLALNLDARNEDLDDEDAPSLVDERMLNDDVDD